MVKKSSSSSSSSTTSSSSSSSSSLAALSFASAINSSLLSFAQTCASLNAAAPFSKTASHVSHEEISYQSCVILRLHFRVSWMHGVQAECAGANVICRSDGVFLAIEHGLALPVALHFVHASSGAKRLSCFTKSPFGTDHTGGLGMVGRTALRSIELSKGTTIERHLRKIIPEFGRCPAT